VKRPDFFIVGAPKCGTTALYEYLRQHPQIFMPFHKEPLYFGSDLTTRYGRMTEDEYLALFAGADGARRVGEASAWYLYSRSAATEIRAFAPEARIIVMLRNPVDMMYAQHSQLLFNGQEDLHDFGEALAAEWERREGRRLPPGPVRRENLFYRGAAHFAEQLQRYLDLFGDKVHVIVFDDFLDDTLGAYRGTLRFLDVDEEFVPRLEVVNDNKRIRNPMLQRLVYAPPGPIRSLIPRLRRYPLVHRLRSMALSLNSSRTPRQPMDPGLRRQLAGEFAGEVDRLGRLIGRDLSSWSAT